NRYSWCGNYQHGFCVVKDSSHQYFHIAKNGNRIYQNTYAYAGDYRDGIAVVQNHDGFYGHIDSTGEFIHQQWFMDLDTFHKGYARAKDAKGWFHIDRQGNSLYTSRYVMIEPFYNGLARVENTSGEIIRINEEGEIIERCRKPFRTDFQQLSGDIVGYWKTQTIKAAVDLNVFLYLPATVEALSKHIGITIENTKRLSRALAECDLVIFQDEKYIATAKAKYLNPQHPYSLFHATQHWATAHYVAWMRLTEALKNNNESYADVYGQPLFEWLDADDDRLNEYQHAMNSYAQHDYPLLVKKLKFTENSIVIDAAGGSGVLLQHVLQENPTMTGILLERPTVIKSITISDDLSTRTEAIGFDLFTEWPCSGDIVLMSRVLHDWNDEQAHCILMHAKNALRPNGQLIIIEFLLEDNHPDGGMLDMNMLVITGGKERTLDQYELLAKKVNLQLIECVHTGNYHALTFKLTE
ncbi:MAG: methyltransferase, partial [Chitinophagaceae bacterium]